MQFAFCTTKKRFQKKTCGVRREIRYFAFDPDYLFPNTSRLIVQAATRNNYGHSPKAFVLPMVRRPGYFYVSHLIKDRGDISQAEGWRASGRHQEKMRNGRKRRRCGEVKGVKNTKYKNRRSGDQSVQTSQVFGGPVGSGALIHAVMDTGDNALSSIPVRSTGPNNTALTVIHFNPYLFISRPADPVLLILPTVLYLHNTRTLLNKNRNWKRSSCKIIFKNLSYTDFLPILWTKIFVKTRSKNLSYVVTSHTLWSQLSFLKCILYQWSY